MTKTFIIQVPVWEAEVIVGVGYSTRFNNLVRNRVESKAAKKFLKELETYEGKCYSGKPGVIWLKKFSNTPACINTLVHEILHMVHGILYRKGLTLTSSSEEAFCYLTGYLTEQILIKLRKK